jgi:hypothetical protein
VTSGEFRWRKVRISIRLLEGVVEILGFMVISRRTILVRVEPTGILDSGLSLEGVVKSIVVVIWVEVLREGLMRERGLWRPKILI